MTIAGYRGGDATLPASAVGPKELDALRETVLLTEDDVGALRRSGPILEPQVNAILEVWYGFVGSKPFLLEHFSDPRTGTPIGAYLERVRARFGQWILDTAAARYDEDWLRWQLEIGRRHHRVGKNRTDGATSSAVVPFRFLFLLAQPVVTTLRPFLAAGGDPPAVVDAMQEAWRKSVLLQLTLWSHPYVREGDY